MRFWAFVAAIICGLLAFHQSAEAGVTIQVDLSGQKMHVTNGAGETFDWAVSSGRSGFGTPHGTYKPYSLQRMHYSRKYHMSPMPYSIFFHGGYAIHGTYSVRELGRPASHGCVRLSPANAATLFAMVQKEGADIAITGTPPGRAYAAKSAGKTRVAKAKAHHKATQIAGKPQNAKPMAYAPMQKAPSLHEWFDRPGSY